MKKNSSKIIILFLLTIFLWSGVNFSFQKKEFIVTTEKAYGLVIPGEQPVVPTVTPTTGSTDATNCNTQKAAWQANPNNGNLNKAYTDCLKATMQMAAAESAAGQMYDNILTAAIKGLDIAEMLSESVLKTVLTVIASIYQFAIIPLLGVLVRIAAGCLDLALRFTLDSKNITNIDGAIQQTWMIIRNIFNITFIFILLYKKLAAAFSREVPIITIRIINYSVNIMGEVLRPGKYLTQNDRITIFDGLALAGDMTLYGRRDNVKVLREKVDGTLEYITLNLNDKNIIYSPAFYLEQNDVVYVEPNKSRSRSSNFGAAESFGISSLSILITLTSLIFTVFKK